MKQCISYNEEDIDLDLGMIRRLNYRCLLACIRIANQIHTVYEDHS